MTRRRPPSFLNGRDKARRQGTERANFERPIFASMTQRPPRPPVRSKEELREEAERALREWHRRFDPGGAE